MASSMQTIRASAVVFNDLDLIVVICLLHHQLHERAEAGSKLRALVDAWRSALRGYGPGTIDLKLDELTRVDRDELASALQVLRDDVLAVGDVLPRSLLRERCEVPGVEFADYETSRVTGSISQLQGLLAADLDAAIEQLLQDYFDGTFTRAETYERILGLVATHGADAVFAALPPPWRRAFYDWAKQMFDNDIPLDQFVKIGSGLAPDEAVELLRAWLTTHREAPADPPTPAHIEDYFIHTPNDLDFTKLDNETLFQLAIQRTEPFLATSALGELTQRRTRHARDAAETVLRRPIWDHFHTSYAIGVLYSRDPLCGLELIVPLLESDDPVVLDAMVDVVLENPQDFSKPRRREFASKLAARVAATAPGPFTDRQHRADFLAKYGAKES